MGSHSVTCHPAEVTFPPLPQPKLVLDLATYDVFPARGRHYSRYGRGPPIVSVRII